MRQDVYRKFSRFAVTALTGQTKVGATIAVYTLCALLLLAYVSVQIYAGVLRQEISQLKLARSEVKEALNKLTGDYVSLSSRERVSDYCENRLGMVRVGWEDFEVLAVSDVARVAPPTALTQKQGAIPAAYRYTYRQSNESPGQ
jgi:cell division protein FtsL